MTSVKTAREASRFFFRAERLDSRNVKIRAAPQLGTEEGELLTDLQRIPLLCPLIEHVHCQAGGARFCKLIGRIPRVDHQIQIHHRDGMPFGENDLQAV